MWPQSTRKTMSRLSPATPPPHTAESNSHTASTSSSSTPTAPTTTTTTTLLSSYLDLTWRKLSHYSNELIVPYILPYYREYLHNPYWKCEESLEFWILDFISRLPVIMGQSQQAPSLMNAETSNNALSTGIVDGDSSLSHRTMASSFYLIPSHLGRFITRNITPISHTLLSLGIISFSYFTWRVSKAVVRFLSLTFIGDVDSYSGGGRFSRRALQGKYWYEQGSKLYLDASPGNEAQEKQALKCFLKAARYQNEGALLKCAIFYQKGIGTEKNQQLAFKYFQKCVQKSNNAEAHFNLGEYYSRGFNGTVETITTNNGKKKKRISNVSRTRGSDRNLKQAFHHYKLAAVKGNHVDAMLKLAACFDYGYAITVDPAQAFHWYSKAAHEGSKVGARELALRYDNGVGCHVDKEKAQIWRERYEEFE